MSCQKQPAVEWGTTPNSPVADLTNQNGEDNLESGLRDDTDVSLPPGEMADSTHQQSVVEDEFQVMPRRLCPSSTKTR